MKNGKRQSVGVVPFKHLIKWLYPDATRCFDACAAEHDFQYQHNVDWTCEDPTARIDLAFYGCCLKRIEQEDDPALRDKLLKDANLFYRVARAWGKGRAFLWDLGIRY